MGCAEPLWVLVPTFAQELKIFTMTAPILQRKMVDGKFPRCSWATYMVILKIHFTKLYRSFVPNTDRT